MSTTTKDLVIRYAVPAAVVLSIVIFALFLRTGGTLPQTPEAAVDALFDAAGRGNDRAYLRLLGPRLRREMENTRSQIGTEAFRQSLRLSVADIKGLAVMRAEEPAPNEVVIRAELVFTDRNEVQRITTQRQSGGWIITGIETAQMEKPPIAYGTPVYDIRETTEQVTSQQQGKPDAGASSAQVVD